MSLIAFCTRHSQCIRNCASARKTCIEFRPMVQVSGVCVRGLDWRMVGLVSAIFGLDTNLLLALLKRSRACAFCLSSVWRQLCSGLGECSIGSSSNRSSFIIVCRPCDSVCATVSASANAVCASVPLIRATKVQHAKTARYTSYSFVFWRSL